MKVILISLVVPTEENFRSASALPFHLAKNRNNNTELKIYSFNTNNCDLSTIDNNRIKLNAEIRI